MSLFDGLFRRQKVECPRCLGKGMVDWEDIKRLNNELKWRPGKCAFCNGIGVVSSKMIYRVKADNSYLTTGISQDERNRLFDGEVETTLRAEDFDNHINDFIKQIEYLYFVGNLDEIKIADFYLINKPVSNELISKKQELIEYVQKVVKKKAG
jgi:hypothetical protein